MLAKAGPSQRSRSRRWLAWAARLGSRRREDRGRHPAGPAAPHLPSFDPCLWRDLAFPALLISVVGFVESVSVAQTLAAKRRQRIEPNQELVALGASNVGAAFTGGFPVTGGFARSVVNFDAGAQTRRRRVHRDRHRAASLLLTPALYFLPQATLAATIVVAVLSLVDLGVLRRTWAYSRADFAAVAVTLLATLVDRRRAGALIGGRRRVARAVPVPHQPAAHRERWGSCRGPSTSATCCAIKCSSARGSSACAWTRACISPMRARWRTRSTGEVASVALNCSTSCCSARQSTHRSSALESLEAVMERAARAGIRCTCRR